MMALFSGNTDISGTHGLPVFDGRKWSIKSTAKTLRVPVTEDLWAQHLDGLRPLGVITIRRDNTCLWGSIDIDEYDDNPLEVIETSAIQKLPLVPCRSKSGGLHMFMFLTEAQPAGQVLAVLRELSASLGKAGSEIFPKQATVQEERGDMGSWMVMPYYGGTFDGKLKEQVGLTRNGLDMTLTAFLIAAEGARLTPAQFAELETRRPTAARAPRPTRGKPADGPFADGPPCLQHLTVHGVEPGGQNNTLLQMGIYYKRAFPDEWKAKLEEANYKHLRPPGSVEGLTSAIRSLERKEYNYMCKTEPMASHCDSAVCRSRRYGVGDEGNYPVISGLTRFQTDPVIWFVDVDNERLEVDTDTLINYRLFQRACVANLAKLYRPMKEDAWNAIIRSVMDNFTDLPAPVDVGERERLREQVEEFLTNRQRGTMRDDLLLGRPYEDQEAQLHYFRLRDLQEFLVREGMRDMTRGKLARAVERMGGTAHHLSIKNKSVNVWTLPSSVAQANPSVPAPPVPGSPI